MRLCLMIEGQEDVTWEDWEALADACEASRFEALFRSDHYLSGDGRNGRGALDAWTTLAAIAVRTERIRLGTMVSPVTFRHPSLLSRAAVTVDHISGGRAEVGLGAGWYEAEHEAFGFPFPPLGERMELLAEQLEIVRRQWDEDEPSFAGTHYRLDRSAALPKPVQARMPLIVGGSGKPRTVAMAARWADEYNAVEGDPETCRRLRRALDDACRAEGRDPSSLVFSIMTTVLVGRDQGELEARAARLAELFSLDKTPAQVIEDNRADSIVGTVEEAAERLGQLEAAGVQRVMLQHLDHRDLDAVALLGGELAEAVS
jgi:F420-dependent oxidoreductase-like protein